MWLSLSLSLTLCFSLFEWLYHNLSLFQRPSFSFSLTDPLSLSFIDSLSLSFSQTLCFSLPLLNVNHCSTEYIQLLRVLVSFHPTAIHTATLGAQLHANGKWTEAVEWYDKALEMNPTDDLTKKNLEKVRRLLTRNNEGKGWMLTATWILQKSTIFLSWRCFAMTADRFSSWNFPLREVFLREGKGGDWLEILGRYSRFLLLNWSFY